MINTLYVNPYDIKFKFGYFLLMYTRPKPVSLVGFLILRIEQL